MVDVRWGRVLTVRAGLAVVACWLGLVALPAQALQAVDDRGVTVVLPRAPQRIVSLLPSLTETVCALGACARLVGVDRYSNFPAQVLALPKVGGGIDPSIEAVVAQRPDLVLAAMSSRGIERLEALGLKVAALEPRTVADAQRVLGVVGQLLDVPDAPRVWREVEAGVVVATQTLPRRARPVRVYFEASGGPYAAGPPSFIGETLTRMGVANVMPPALGAFPKVNPEFVVRADPDLIMISERNAQGLAQRPGWSGLRAVRENRVCVFGSSEFDMLVRAGPRMAEAARLMAACLKDKAPWEKAP